MREILLQRAADSGHDATSAHTSHNNVSSLAGVQGVLSDLLTRRSLVNGRIRLVLKLLQND